MYSIAVQTDSNIFCEESGLKWSTISISFWFYFSFLKIWTQRKICNLKNWLTVKAILSTFSGNHFIPLGLTVLENNSLGLINVHWIPINAQSSGLIISVAYWNRGDSFAINYQLPPLWDPCCWNWFGLGHFIRMKIYCFMAHIISICFC